MTNCAVPGCKENASHLFPKDKNKKKLWAEAIRRPKLSISQSLYLRLCGLHFTESDFKTVGSSTGFNLQRRILQENAVPSVFPWCKAPPTDAAARKERLPDRNQSDYDTEDAEEKPAQFATWLRKAGSPRGGAVGITPNERQVMTETADKYDVLGKYVAEKVRELRKDQRIFVERVIHETIFEGQMGKLNINSQLILNTETFVSGPSDYAKKMHLEGNSAKKDVSKIKIESDMNDHEDNSSLTYSDIDEDSHVSDDADTGAKRRRLKDPEPDETSELHLEDLPDIKVEIGTEEHDNLEGFETENLRTNVSSTRNIGESNPEKRKISDKPKDAATHSEQIDKIKIEIDIEDNWNLQDVSDTNK